MGALCRLPSRRIVSKSFQILKASVIRWALVNVHGVAEVWVPAAINRTARRSLGIIREHHSLFNEK